jgi:hypothetical protein
MMAVGGASVTPNDANDAVASSALLRIVPVGIAKTLGKCGTRMSSHLNEKQPSSWRTHLNNVEVTMEIPFTCQPIEVVKSARIRTCFRE